MWPGLAIALTVLAFNLLGDGLRDAMGRDTVRVSQRSTSKANRAHQPPAALRAARRFETTSTASPAKRPTRGGPLLEVEHLAVEFTSPTAGSA